MFIKKTLFNLLRSILIGIVLNPIVPVDSQIYLTEGFETGAKPDGWTEEFISGTEPWRFRNGGHSPNDNNWLVPPGQKDITRNPPAAYEGTYNAIFFKQGDNNERTMLTSPEMDLLGGADLELSFYLCQIPWTFEGAAGWDVLRVYYKVSQTSPWILLHEYLDPIYSWTRQTLVLPNASSTYYIGFEGHTRWGYGTCIDNIKVESKGIQPYWIRDIGFQQLFTKSVPSGSSDVPVMRVDFTLLGNTGNAILDKIRFTSLNTADSDIKPGGVKLYSTGSQTFSTATPLGSPTDFISGIADFSGLNYIMPAGQSYLWLTYDIKSEAAYGNILDARVAVNGILANDSLYPSVEKSPDGYRLVHRTQYFENFESTHNWSLTGEFEVGSPSGKGGSPGNPDPASAFSGSKILGTDLSGIGPHLYNYEPEIGEAASYKATSPVIDLFYYKNLNIFFQRHLNIEVWDNSSVQVSTDNGNSWNTIWKNTSYVNDFQWEPQQIPIPDAYSRTNQLKIRYQLGPTDVQNSYSGWNIDDIYITGEFITKDAGVSEWIYPLSGSGHTAYDSVTVRITNYGGAAITDPVPVSISFNSGLSWVTDIMNTDIPIGGSVIFTLPSKMDLSVPGPRSALAKTILPGDQYPGNDKISNSIYIVPTFKPPYAENFETSGGFWRAMGNEIWEYGTPAGSVINSASSGIKSWVTGLTETYEDIITRKNKIIFEDDFEFDQEWTFTGEFERNSPNYAFLPYFANSGYHCLGIDLSGKGAKVYKYENGISPASAYTATSRAFDVRNYSNLIVSFSSWITIQQGDSIKFEVSPDNGSTWYSVWNNAGAAIIEEGFSIREFQLADHLNNSNMLKFRFSLYSSSASGPVAEGWSIDDFMLTGNLVNTGAGYLASPDFDLTGLTSPVFEAKLWIDTEKDVDGVTLQFSLDDGKTWNDFSFSSTYDTYWKWYTGKPVTTLASDGWSGQSNGWITVRHLLPSVLINRPSVQFRLKFMADKVNNQYDGIAADDIRVIEAPSDLGVVEILAPVTACKIGTAQKFTLRVKNYGIRSLQQGEPVRIGYNINKSGQIQTAEETILLNQPLLQGATIDLNMASEFDFSVPGQYQVKVFTVEPDPNFYQQVSNDSIYRLIYVNMPLVDLGEDISTSRPDQVLLKAFSGIKGYNYLWQDGSTDSVFHVSSPGRYYVRVTNNIGCSATDTINVIRLNADIGVSELIAPISSCNLGIQEPVRINIRNFGTDTLNINDTILIVRKINSDILSETHVLNKILTPGDTLNYTFSATYNFSAPGSYQMMIYTKLRNDINKANDTLKYTLESFNKPLIDLGNDIVVQAPEYVLSAPHGYSGYIWQNGSTGETFTVNQQGQWLYSVTVTDGHLCTNSDSVNVTLNVTDIAISRILSPVTTCTISDTLSVSVRLKNSGNQSVPAGQIIRLSYLINGGSIVNDSLIFSKIFMPGDSIDFLFRQKARVVRGQWYNFSASVNYNTDMRSSNNTLLVPVGVFAAPSVNLGEDYKVVAALYHVLDAGAGYSSYLWNDGSTGRTFKITTPGINTCSVLVTDNNGCTAYDEISIMLAVPDIGITEIINPKTSCSSGVPKNVKVAIRNLGNWDIDKSANISVTYSINGRTPVRENVLMNAVFEKGSTIVYTFKAEEDFSIPGHYSIVSTLGYESDLLLTNNILSTNFDILESPQLNLGQGQDTILVFEPLTLSVPAGYTSYRWQDGSSNTYFEIKQPGGSMYTVTVTGNNACSLRDSVYVAYDVPDIGITRIITPASSCKSDLNNNKVSVEVVNNGFYRIAKNEGINISYNINDRNPVREKVFVSSTLQPGKSGVLTFATGNDFSASGTYLIKVSLESSDNNLSNNTVSSNVIIRNGPEVEIGAGKDTLRNAVLPITLNAGTGYASYSWQDKSSTEKFEVRQEGLYWVIVTDGNGCSSTDSVFVYSSEGQKNFPGKIKIYPNPVSEVLHLIIEMDELTNFRIELFSLVNSLIYSEDFKGIQMTEKDIDVRSYPPGLYFLRITSDKSQYITKIIVN